MRIFAALVIVVGAVAAHFYAMDTGIYAAQLREGVVWFDNILHAAVGLAFGLMWISVLNRFIPAASWSVKIVSLLVFVLLVAVAWEVFEYGFYLVFKSGALGLTVYEPSLQESVVDSLSNIVGATLLLVAWMGFTRHQERPIAE